MVLLTGEIKKASLITLMQHLSALKPKKRQKINCKIILPSALEDKYKALTDAATAAGITDLAVREQDGILCINGTAADGATKDHLWEVYNEIDPNFTSGDLVLNVNVSIDAAVTHAKVITQSSNLNIRKEPETNQPIVEKRHMMKLLHLLT